MTMEQADFGAEEELLAMVRRDLDNVESALAKLEEGTYGLCEDCGEPLGQERLSSSPAERFCASHERSPGHPSLDRDSGRAQDVHR
jgi:RNA polymerase-binding transcription factor DksA